MGRKGEPSSNPKGRPVGSKSRCSALRETALARILSNHKAPLDFLLGIMESDKATMAERTDAAKAALPYVHRKMPVSIENGPNGAFRVFDMSKLAGMSETDLLQLRELIARAVPEDVPGIG